MKLCKLPQEENYRVLSRCIFENTWYNGDTTRHSYDVTSCGA